jgi:beta-lactamase regulating signal transducer with metallopeptidase domain
VESKPVTRRPFDWQQCIPYAMSLYCVGVIGLLIRLLLGLQGGQRLRRFSTPVADDTLLRVLANRAQALKMTWTPTLAFCARIAVPTVVGVIRPTILLPLAFANHLSLEQVEMILTHELAHIRRWDPFVNILQRLIEAVLFFHPAVWFISHKIRVEREHCCDDLALQGGGRPEAYASSLLEMAQQAVQRPLAVEGMTAVTQRPSRLGLRIRRMLGTGHGEEMRLQRPWIMTLACIGVLLWLGSLFTEKHGTAEAASDAGARISMISSDEEGQEKSYRWGVSGEVPLKVVQGWYTYDSEGIREHGGGGRNVAETEAMQLTLTITREGDTLAFHRGTIRLEDTGALTGDVGNKTTWPGNATLRTHFLSESAQLTDTLQPLWKGEMVQQGKVVKTLVYAVRLVGPDESMDLFDVRDPSEVLRISRAWGPEPDPSKQVYNGRTIAQWMTQWDTGNYQDIQKATTALKEIGGPAVPAMLYELTHNGSHANYACRVLGGMGPAAESALDWLINTALDKQDRDPKDKQRTYALICLTDMTWAYERLQSVFEAVALDSDDEDSLRRIALSGLKNIGLSARAVIEKVTQIGSGRLKEDAHGILADLLTQAGHTSKQDYFAQVIEQNPFDESVPRLLTSSKGIVNQGKPHALTQTVKQRIRARLSQTPDALLAMTLATIIQNGLMGTELEWAAPTDSSSGQWNREDPVESFYTLGEALEIGFAHAEQGSDLRMQCGLALARQALLMGDWGRMNQRLQSLGQAPVPAQDRAWLPAPPTDWQTGLRAQWQTCDESMRNGTCSLEFQVEKGGQGLSGVHVLVKQPPDPSRRFSTGIAADTLFHAPCPLDVYGSFGYQGPDRSKTRYAVTDASGRVRFEKLPEMPIKIEVLVPTANFKEPGSSWDLWMEVEPGEFKMARRFGGPETVSPIEPPAVVTLKPGETVQYPKLVVRPAFALNIADWDRVDKDDFVLAWQGMDSSRVQDQGIEYELDMHLCTPSQSPGGTDDTNAIVKTVQHRLTQTRWPVGAQGVGGLHLYPGNIYMFEVRAVDAQDTVVARWPRTRVWVPWTHRKSPAPVTRDMDRMGPPIYNTVWHRGSFDYGDGTEETLRQKTARLIQEAPDAFEWEYLKLGKAWLDWDDGGVDIAKEQLARLIAALPRGNLVRGTAASLLEQLKQGDKAPRRLTFVPDEIDRVPDVPEAKDLFDEHPSFLAPGFNIYLLEDETLTWDDCNDTPLHELVLRPEPWIRASDILRYDQSTHCMTLKQARPVSLERVSLRGNPFVVCTGDERCYLGSVWSHLSSYLPSGVTPMIYVPDFSHPPNVVGIELLRVQSREGYVSSLDVRNDFRVLETLKAQGVAHTGLSMDLGPVTVVSDAYQASVTYTYTLTNQDTDALYVFDPDKMGSALFYGFNNPPFLRGPDGLQRIENKNIETFGRDVYNQYKKEWFTLMPAGASMTWSVTSKGYPVLPPGSYEVGIAFGSPGKGFTQEKQAQFDAPVWIGQRGIRGTVTVPETKMDTPEAPSVWVTLLPKSPIVSFQDYVHFFATTPAPEPPLYRPVPWPACDFEIRRADTQQRVARMPYASAFNSHQLQPAAQRRIGDLPQGDYVVALCIGSQRCSNVAQVTLGPITQTDILNVVSLPLAPEQSLPVIGIRAVGPTPQDQTLTNMDIAFPRLWVDGVERQLREQTWTGPVGPLQPGQVYTRLVHLDRYTPAIEPGKQHTVKAIVKRYESPPVVIPADDVLGRAWDSATASLAPLAVLTPSLRGQVTGLNGTPGVGYEVTLTQMNGSRITEQTDSEGHYAMYNVPSGTYMLICNTGGGKARPELAVESVKIEGNTPQTLDVSLETRHHMAGQVTYEDGRIAQGMDVTLVTQDSTGQSTFDNFTTTDANGIYLLSTAFNQVSYMGVHGRRIKGPMPHLESELTHLGFVLKINQTESYDAFPLDSRGNKTREFIHRIRLNEQKIRNVQLHLICTLPSKHDGLLYEGDWGYGQGKEYFKEMQYSKPENPGSIVTTVSGYL